MGHGISFHFESKPRGLLRRRRSSRALVSELADGLRSLTMPASTPTWPHGVQCKSSAWLAFVVATVQNGTAFR